MNKLLTLLFSLSMMLSASNDPEGFSKIKEMGGIEEYRLE